MKDTALHVLIILIILSIKNWPTWLPLLFLATSVVTSTAAAG